MDKKSYVDEESLNLGGDSSDGSMIDEHSGGQKQISQKMQETRVKTTQEIPTAVNDNNDKSSETFVKDGKSNFRIHFHIKLGIV